MPSPLTTRPARPGSGRRRPRLESFEDRLAPAVVTFQLFNDWGTGFTADIRISNDAAVPINGWRLEFDFPYQITDIWNGVVAGHVGDHYAINDAGYNGTILPGQAVDFGFNGSPGHVTGQPANYILNGVPLGGGPLPALSVSDTTVTEPSGIGMAPGFLHTSGNQIVDAIGRAVRLSGVSWFGMESSTFAPHGLWARSYQSMMDQMRDLGFNCIRLPFSDQLFDPGSTPNGIDFNLNPDLQGLTGLQIMDRIVDYAGQIGLRVILDHHRSEAGAGAEANGLWYTDAYPESRWIADWRMLAQRYAGNTTVIGADLHNEPHDPATWGDGTATDWRLAAERAGNAILGVNPNWLILTEGIQTTAAGSTWWGGNLSNAGAFPVRLDVPNRLVYSPHDYPASVYPQPWFGDPNYPHNLYAVWDRYWGYLFRRNTAPVLLGEFGSKLQTTSDQQWMDAITTYLSGDLDGNGTNDLGPGQQGPSWTWWSWNPNSGDTGGILQDDWVHVHQSKVDELKPVQFTTGGPALATFTISLSVASSQTVMVDYSTVDGTATAGADYTAVSGTLTFQPGEVTKTVSVPVLTDNLVEPPETFTLRLSNPRFATLADPDGVGTILDAGPVPPTIRAGDVQVTEGEGGTTDATFTVTLSAASSQPVTVDYATADGTAVSGSDYLPVSGTLTFAPGVTTQTVAVPIVGDAIPEPTETFRLNLSNPTNATLGSDHGTGTIVDNDGSADVRVGYHDRDDWGTGFVADMWIINNTPTAITGWALEFDFDHEITNIWNARIVSHVGSHYVIQNESWNPVIAANGGRVDFGFQGAPGNAADGPRNYVLNGEPVP